MVGANKALVPADKYLYALRDVTATVNSIPLIASSIMSKKLASGVDGIVLDVKAGSGAILRTERESLELAQAMVRVCTLAGKPVIALLSGMDQPLGTHVGNALEVKEAIDLLSGRAGGDLLEVSLMLGSYMLQLAGKADSDEAGREMLKEALESGRGLDKLRQMVTAQGGDPAVCDDVGRLPQAPVIRTMRCEQAGAVIRMNTAALGLAAQAMGAGRLRKEDPIDPAVGFILKVRIGDRVTPETVLCELHARTEADADRAARAIRAASSYSTFSLPTP